MNEKPKGWFEGLNPWKKKQVLTEAAAHEKRMQGAMGAEQEEDVEETSEEESEAAK